MAGRVRAKKGGEFIGGRFFKGGQFIPDDFLVITPSLVEISKRYKKGAGKQLAKGVEKIAERLYRRLKRNTPVRTGALLRSMRLDRTGDLVWKMSENVDPPYGLFQRRGVPAVKINPIAPVRKEALWWPEARHPVKIVRNHPGIKANDYAARTVKESAGDLRKAGDDLGAEITTSVIV